MDVALDCEDLSRNELAAEVVRSFGELRLRVTGSSMLPAVRPGDVLLIRHCSIEEPDLGDVVLFTRQRRLFAHRVVSRSSACLVTQGDAIAAPDPAVSASELLGKVVGVQRRGMPVSNRSKLTFSGRMTAALVRRSARAGSLLNRLHGLQLRTGL
jgi:signal peptidase